MARNLSESVSPVTIIGQITFCALIISSGFRGTEESGNLCHEQTQRRPTPDEGIGLDWSVGFQVAGSIRLCLFAPFVYLVAFAYFECSRATRGTFCRKSRGKRGGKLYR